MLRDMAKSVRLSDYLYEEIERLARAEKRSLANMVKVLLEQALALPDSYPDLAGSLSERDKAVSAVAKDAPKGDQEHAARGVVGSNPTSEVSRSENDSHFKPDFK